MLTIDLVDTRRSRTPVRRRHSTMLLSLAVAGVLALILGACDDGGGDGGDDTATMDTAADSVGLDTASDMGTGDTSSGGCTADVDCTDPGAPYCNVGTGFCHECLDASHCPFDNPICTDLGQCGTCQADSQCDAIEPGTTCVDQLGICQECIGDDACEDPTPYCSSLRQCGECRTPFHCTDPARPTCADDPETGRGVCVAFSSCDSSMDDPRDNRPDDGPLGATNITPMDGETTRTLDGMLCDSPPQLEADWFSVQVADGDNLTVTADWGDASGVDIDISVYDGDGFLLGESWYQSPEVVTLTHLPAGTIYIALVRFGQNADPDNPTAAPYTITAELTPGGCTAVADCAAAYETQFFRGECAPSGACVRIDGDGTVPLGGACDSPGDCETERCGHGASNTVQVGFDLDWFFATYFADSQTRAVCTQPCMSDADCDGLRVCTTVFGDRNYCMDPCVEDADCPVNLTATPAAGETWSHLACNDGHCEER